MKTLCWFPVHCERLAARKALERRTKPAWADTELIKLLKGFVRSWSPFPWSCVRNWSHWYWLLGPALETGVTDIGCVVLHQKLESLMLDAWSFVRNWSHGCWLLGPAPETGVTDIGCLVLRQKLKSLMLAAWSCAGNWSHWYCHFLNNSWIWIKICSPSALLCFTLHHPLPGGRGWCKGVGYFR